MLPEKPRALCAQIQHLIGLKIMLPLASMVVMWSLATIAWEIKHWNSAAVHTKWRKAVVSHLITAAVLVQRKACCLLCDCHIHSPRGKHVSPGAAALEAEMRKHRANDPKCSELGWVCVALAVETYSNWGKEARAIFSRLASCITTTSSCHKNQVLGEMYGRLNFTLVRAIAKANLGRCLPTEDKLVFLNQFNGYIFLTLCKTRRNTHRSSLAWCNVFEAYLCMEDSLRKPAIINPFYARRL